MDITNYITEVEGFPRQGISFKDTTPILAHPQAMAFVTAAFAAYGQAVDATVVVGPEARGFAFGTPTALEMGVGFVPVRKPGKLPRPVVSVEYSLEYGSDRLSMHSDAVQPGDRVLIVDDLLATGGTVRATAQLVEALGAQVVGCAFIIELLGLPGRDVLSGYDLLTLTQYSC